MTPWRLPSAGKPDQSLHSASIARDAITASQSVFATTPSQSCFCTILTTPLGLPLKPWTLSNEAPCVGGLMIRPYTIPGRRKFWMYGCDPAAIDGKSTRGTDVPTILYLSGVFIGA